MFEGADISVTALFAAVRVWFEIVALHVEGSLEVCNLKQRLRCNRRAIVHDDRVQKNMSTEPLSNFVVDLSWSLGDAKLNLGHHLFS